MSEIKPLELADCSAVAALHLKALRTGFRKNPGLQILRLYYACLAQEQGGRGFVAYQEDQLIGFVCGVWDSQKTRSFLIKKYAIPTAFWGAMQALVAPGILRSFLPHHSSSDSAEDHWKFAYELRPLAVDESARGKGVAKELTERLVEDARQFGFQCVDLITEEDNFAAQKFYSKAGFHQMGPLHRGGNTYIWYQRTTAAPEFISS